MPQSYLKFESSIKNDIKRALPAAGGVIIMALITQVRIKPAWDIWHHVIHPLSMGIAVMIGGLIAFIFCTPQHVEIDEEGLRVYRGGAVTENIVWARLTKARLSRGGCWLFWLGRSLTWMTSQGFSRSQWKCISQAILGHIRNNRI